MTENPVAERETTASTDGSDTSGPDQPTSQGDDFPGRDRRRMAWLILVAIIIIVILLLLRSCGNAEGGAGSSGGGFIGEFEELEPHTETVAVWVRPGADLKDVLARNDLAGARVTDLEDGSYVIDIGDADVDRVVERLKNDEGLVDAGYVFLEEPR